ncbi:DUF5710 domain-containing protein [Deefgea sp. CFH1-16]|uniref:DUF5710 domain-containing protein n=1 Tax=Deefgea sp. CFH1-16 TaxID=2675457 RepID=UPI0015F44657|nr:DUF5710 domain-containing protein [Deefgea sp. CFH1-16]MBM5574127.1 hypothetical protein [Deefgea sp. CFH1-16]
MISSKVQVYLNVPFKEKDQAKALGARFNPELKQWYVPHGVDVTRFVRWLPDAAQFAITAETSAAVKKPKAKVKSAPIVQTPLPPLRALLPANADLNDPPWDV